MLDTSGMDTNNPQIGRELMPAERAARILRVPATWLKGEVEAGRLPGLQAGRSILVHFPTIETLLADRARQGGVA